MCVSECPATEEVTTLRCSPNSVVTSCEGVNSSEQPAEGDAALHIYPSTELGTFCLPTSEVADDILKKYLGGEQGNFLGNTAETLTQKKWYFLVAMVIAVVLTVAYLFVMRCCVGVIVWLSVFAVLGLLIGAGVICFLRKWIELAVVLWVMAFLYLVVFICCNFKRLKLAIAIYKAASRMVSSNLRLILVPVVTTLLIVAFLMWWALSGALWISRSLVAEKGDIITSIGDYTGGDMLYTYYYLFSGLWVVAWISATGQYVIIVFSSIWYYHQKEDSEAHSPLSTGIKWAFLKNIGSIAFGAFFVAVIEMLRIILEFVIQQTKQQQSGATETVANCARCCLGCLQKIIECINRTAYTFIALSGEKYCVSARKGISLALANPVYMLILSGVGEAIQMLGNLLISTLTSIIFYFMAGLNYGETSRGVVPVLLVFLMTYLIASIFMGVETTSADAMIICFFIDNEFENKHGGNQADRAPEEFKSLY